MTTQDCTSRSVSLTNLQGLKWMSFHVHLVEPYTLSRTQLYAEYRNIPKIVDRVRKALKRGQNPLKHPVKTYHFGDGHTVFFYTRLGYLNQRYHQIVSELKSRGFHPSPDQELRSVNQDIPDALWQDWTPQAADIALSQHYLLNKHVRSSAKPTYHDQ